MGKPTGFLEIERQDRGYEKPEARAADLAGIRPAAAGRRSRASRPRAAWIAAFPFCHNGCPVNNLIPDWNNLVYRDQWRDALDDAALDQQFPGIHRPHLPGAVRGVLHAQHRRQSGHHQNHRMRDRRSRLGGGLDRAAARRRRRPARRVAVVGSGPAGLACAQQLARAGHAVTLFEKTDRIGGLLRYGIPDFKMEKHLIDRRMRQMEAEGVAFRTGVEVGVDVSVDDRCSTDYDAVVLTGGAECAARSARCRAASSPASISPWIS